ncbi:acyl-CoA synthetase (AMP-forming)/AMP-acid ligase II [Nocardioides sp. BE266]|uniref:AMP-binding protein n=1 Tax=Nocardioides sp. BE266 TaxID=2817725 RepID=UPI0028594024|nr:AMP-binding protein [Nocardioides sp. BE266]MDR7254204.1 acyl-CoA synthetase (AMP-forming)/AMP-acid ligase II [Nocardioides sp. BE266]
MDIDVESLYDRPATGRWNRMVLGDVLERITWSQPDREAIVGWSGAFGSPRFERLTYREGDEAANQVAHALLSAGLERGARVLLYCENSVEAVVTMLGIAKAGLVCVPLNPLLAPDVVTYAIEHVGATFAIVDAELWPRAEAAFSESGLAPSVTIPIGGGAVEGTLLFEDWIADRPTTDVDIAIHADDIWSLMFTSGTTAMPKASMISHTYGYLASYTYTLSTTRGLRYEDQLRTGTFLPIVYHVGHYAVLFQSWFAAGTAVIGRRPNPPELSKAIASERITAVWGGSPAFLQALVDANDAQGDDLSTLTVVFFSWGAMRPDLIARLKDKARNPELTALEVFGQTESLSCYRFYPDQHPEKHEQSMHGVNYVGVPNPMLAAKVIDAEGRLLRDSPGTAGEAVYRSPAITAGYFRNEEATREAFEGGWFHSGDSCTYDEDGLQIMVDRFKDIVKSGGENVSSLRVETVVAQHPSVGRVAVVGVPSDRWGEEVTAVIVPVAGAVLDPDEVIGFARERLAGYEAPKRVVVVDALPETVGGKILKYKLRSELASPTT